MKEQNGINVLSLFNGLSCGHLALDKVGMKVDKYYSSEIDKHAIQVCQYNYPKTVQLGDVTKWREWDIDWEKIDLLLAGSPCQGFSFAGKQLAFDDPRSKLFFVFVEILEYIRSVNPKVKWLLENVRMKKEHEYVISKTVGIEPVIINSALLSAQNRVRLYWTNFYTKKKGLFETEYCAIPQPKDLGIMLKDVLEAEVDEKYYLKDKAILRSLGNSRSILTDINEEEKSGSILANQSKQSTDMVSLKIPRNHLQNPVNDFGVVREVDKSLCIDANYHKGMDTHAARTQVMDTKIVASPGRNSENPKSRKAGLETEQQLEERNDGKTNCLTSVQKDNLVIQINLSRESGGKQPYQQNRVYDTEGKAPQQEQELSPPGNKIIETKNYVQFEGNGFDQDNRAYFEEGKSGSVDTKAFRQKVFLTKKDEFNGLDKEGKARTLRISGKSSRDDKHNFDLIKVPEATKKGFTEIAPGECFDAEHLSSSTRRGRKMENKSNTLMAKETDFMQYTPDFRIRRLTPIECARLQTIPDGYFINKETGKYIVSETQVYRQCGNGWTVDVIAYLLSFMNK